MGERVDVIGEHSGLHILLKVKNGMSEQKLIEAAAKQGVTIYPTSIYYHPAKKTDAICTAWICGTV
ncbi:hypothetical protein AAAC51_04490 [Priestia megaterium]